VSRVCVFKTGAAVGIFISSPNGRPDIPEYRNGVCYWLWAEVLPSKVETCFVYGAVQGKVVIVNHTPGSGAYMAKFNFHSYCSDIILY